MYNKSITRCVNEMLMKQTDVNQTTSPESRTEERDIEFALNDVRRAVDDVIQLYRMPAFDLTLPINHRWSMKDMLAHLVAWHESFAKNLALIAAGALPEPPRGSLREVNRDGVQRLREQSLNQLIRRFRKAQRIIEAHAFDVRITIIPYRKPGTSYSRLQHLEIVAHHIRGHFWEIIGKSLRNSDRIVQTGI